MNKRFSAELLFRIRNQVSIADLIIGRLDMPWKISEGFLRFLCPMCGEFRTAVNPTTNLARCFRCQKNFNPIEMVMAVRHCTFVQAVYTLIPLLPAKTPRLPPTIPMRLSTNRALSGQLF